MGTAIEGKIRTCKFASNGLKEMKNYAPDSYALFVSLERMLVSDLLRLSSFRAAKDSLLSRNRSRRCSVPIRSDESRADHRETKLRAVRQHVMAAATSLAQMDEEKRRIGWILEDCLYLLSDLGEPEDNVILSSGITVDALNESDWKI